MYCISKAKKKQATTFCGFCSETKVVIVGNLNKMQFSPHLFKNDPTYPSKSLLIYTSASPSLSSFPQLSAIQQNKISGCCMSRETGAEKSQQYQKAVKYIIYSVTPLKEME